MTETTKFCREERIYPDRVIFAEKYGAYHCFAPNQKTPAPRVVYKFIKAHENRGTKYPAQYELGSNDSSGTRFDQVWVEKMYRSEAEHVEHLLLLAETAPEARTVDARNELMDIGDRLTVEVSSFRGDCLASAFENLLNQWTKHGYRPTLCLLDPKAKLLADIYDFAQKVRGVDVVAYRSKG